MNQLSAFGFSAFRVVIVTPDTATDDDAVLIVNTDLAPFAFVLNLPTVIGRTGRIYVCKNGGSNGLLVLPDGTDKIVTSTARTQLTISAGKAVSLVSDGVSNWYVLTEDTNVIQNV